MGQLVPRSESGDGIDRAAGHAAHPERAHGEKEIPLPQLVRVAAQDSRSQLSNSHRPMAVRPTAWTGMKIPG